MAPAEGDVRTPTVDSRGGREGEAVRGEFMTRYTKVNSRYKKEQLTSLCERRNGLSNV